MSETTNLKLFKQDNPTTNTNNFDIEKTLNANWDKLDENAGTTNKKLESLEKVESTTNETITAIQEEQTTQNENIEKNAEGIAQNKKDADEEFTKLKEENNVLKEQIPTGTASGNSIHLEDSSNMDFEWTLRGGSRQATRSGYNLANLDADSFVKNGVTVTNNGDGSWTFNGTSSSFDDLILTKNISLNHKIYQFEDAKYLFKTIVVSGSFSNPDKVIVQTSAMGQDNGADNFATLYNKLSDGVFVNIFNKKSTSHLSRFELYCGPNVTFNNYTIKILFAKTDNNKLEWEQYGVSPSLDFPSEIKNIGDDVNLAYISSKKDYNYSSTLEKDVVLINGTSTNAGNIELYLNGDDGITLKANKKYIVSLFFDGHVTGNGYKTIYLQGMPIGDIASNKMVTKEIILSDDKVCKTINLDLSANCTFDNMKVKVMITENGKLKEYIPYNCIKATICNKNIINILDATEKTINGVTYSIKNGEITLNGTTNQDLEIVLARNISLKKETYTHSCSDILAGVFISLDNIGETMLSGPNRKTIMFNLQNDKVFSKYFMYINNGTTFNNTKIKLQIEKGRTATGIVTHLEQEIIFPLAEGQKLYEGSYLAEDGIHNTRTQIKLLSSSGDFFVSALGNYQVFGKTQKGVKRKSRLLSNYFKDYGSVNAIKDTVGIANDSTADRIYVSNGISTTLDEFKDWLNKCENAGRPVILEYELAEEEIIPYTQEQQAVIDKILYTYKNVTNISVDDELATLDITYKKDIETMFNNQAKEYNERLSNIENLLNTTETSALLLDNLENDLEKEV